MLTSFKEEDNNLVMYFEGRLDTDAAPQTGQDMKPLYDCEGRNVILDCTRLEYISSSGLRLFLGLLKVAKPKGSHVLIRGLNDSLHQVFAMTGFTKIFEFV